MTWPVISLVWEELSLFQSLILKQPFITKYEKKLCFRSTSALANNFWISYASPIARWLEYSGQDCSNENEDIVNDCPIWRSAYTQRSATFCWLTANLSFQITHSASNIRIFIPVKVNIIITKSICKTWSFCVPLEVAWRAKCGTRAVSADPGRRAPANLCFVNVWNLLHNLYCRSGVLALVGLPPLASVGSDSRQLLVTVIKNA